MTTARTVWHGAATKALVLEGARAAIAETTAEVLDASLKLVPRETDALAGAGATSLADYGAVGAVYYDDPRDVKTIKQHEDLTYRHPRGGQAKFLERPVRAARGAYVAALARHIGRRLR